MKNICLIIIIPVLLVSINLGAQPTPIKKWVLIVSDNFSGYAGVQGPKFTSNPSIGLFARFPITKRFSIDPRLFVRYTGGVSSLTTSAPTQYPKNLFDTTNVQRTTTYVSILAPVSYQITKAFSVSFGPQFMILTGSTDRFKSQIGNDQLFVDSENSMHKYDAGITGGIVYERYLTWGIQYFYGLMYAIKTNDSQAKNSILQFWIGVPFPKRNRSRKD